MKARQKTDFASARQTASMIRDEIRKVIVGQEEMIDLLITAVLADGHVLLEGVPGVAKTLTARLLARSVDAPFSRIQFTPDLMPSDITGTMIFNEKNSRFEFHHGPVFSSIVLIDEINRAPAKTQAALFEVMEERQVTVDGKSYTMADPFLVVATQNPVEYEGTYRLPEGQLDRFLLKIFIDYPSAAEEESILAAHHGRMSDLVMAIDSVAKGDHITAARELVSSVRVEDSLRAYIVAIVQKTRTHGAIALGGSPRGSIALMNSSRARAVMEGRDFVIPEDIQALAVPVLNHRVILTADRELEGTRSPDVIREIVQSVGVPR